MRLVTRRSLDGLASAVLIDHAEFPESVVLARARDFREGSFEVEPGDILVNLPYHRDCYRWFDHHSSVRGYRRPPLGFDGSYGFSPSTARLVYDFYLHDNPGFALFVDLVSQTDRYESRSLSLEEVTHPEGFLLLGFTIDSLPHLPDLDGYFHLLLETLRDESLEEVMQLADVQERAAHLRAARERYLDQMRELSRLDDNVIVSDLRSADPAPEGNRWWLETLYPDATSSLTIEWSADRGSVIATAAHSRLNRTCPVHVGGLMSKFGGSGFRDEGVTPLDVDTADEKIALLVERLNQSPINAAP